MVCFCPSATFSRLSTRQSKLPGYTCSTTEVGWPPSVSQCREIWFTTQFVALTSHPNLNCHVWTDIGVCFLANCLVSVDTHDRLFTLLPVPVVSTSSPQSLSSFMDMNMNMAILYEHANACMCISRVPSQNRVSQARYIVEIHHSGRKPSIFSLTEIILQNMHMDTRITICYEKGLSRIAVVSC